MKRKHRKKKKSNLKLSQQLHDLAAAFADRPVYMREVMEIMKGHSILPLIIFLNIPFMSPIPLPGYSSIIGVIVMLLCIPIMFASESQRSLPKRVLNWSLPPRFFSLVLKAASKTFYLFELFLRPRLGFLAKIPLFIRLNGAIMVICAALLTLPLPIPFSNGFPAWTIMILAGGMLEYDGAAIILGYVLFVATLIFFGSLTFGGVGVVSWLAHGWF